MWLWWSIAVANPPALDDLGGWSDLLGRALAGPTGCWDLTGAATWAHTARGLVNEGVTDFQVRFEDNRFGTFTLLDPSLTVAPDLADHDLTLQFRPILGGHGHFRLIADPHGLFVRDWRDDDPDDWVPTSHETLYVTPRDDGSVEVWRATSIRGRKGPVSFATGVAPLHVDQIRQVQVGRERHRMRGTLMRHQAEGHVTYSGAGMPASETREVTWRRAGIRWGRYHHTIRYASFVACGSTTPQPPPSGDQHVQVAPRSDAHAPFAVVVTNPDLGSIEALRFEAESLRARANGALILDAAGVAFQGGVLTWTLLREDTTRADRIVTGSVVGAITTWLLIDAGRAVGRHRKARRLRREADALEAQGGSR